MQFKLGNRTYETNGEKLELHDSAIYPDEMPQFKNVTLGYPTVSFHKVDLNAANEDFIKAMFSTASSITLDRTRVNGAVLESIIGVLAANKSLSDLSISNFNFPTNSEYKLIELLCKRPDIKFICPGVEYSPEAKTVIDTLITTELAQGNGNAKTNLETLSASFILPQKQSEKIVTTADNKSSWPSCIIS